MLFLLTLGVFGVALFGMSVGVIFSDRRIQGSCGGSGKEIGGKKLACDGCPSGEKYCSGGGHHDVAGGD